MADQDFETNPAPEPGGQTVTRTQRQTLARKDALRIRAAAAAAALLGVLEIVSSWTSGFSPAGVVAGLALLIAGFFVWRGSFVWLAAFVSLTTLLAVFAALHVQVVGVLIDASFAAATGQALPILWSRRLARRRAGSDPRSGASKSDQFELLVIMFATIAVLVAGATKLAAGGWYIIIFGLPYIAVLVAHFLVHRRASRALDRTAGALITAIGSDLLLIVGFLLQLDQGDNPNPWLTITALTSDGPGYPGSDAPNWWPGSVMNLVVLLPVAVSWVALLILPRHRRNFPPNT
jgi:hypothetical protein